MTLAPLLLMIVSQLDVTLDRQMPQSPDAERAVLGAILINNNLTTERKGVLPTVITLIEFIILYYVAQTHELLNILWVFALAALVIIFAASMLGVALSGIFRGRTIGIAAPLAISTLIFVAACSIPSVVGLNEPITGPLPVDGPPVYNVALSAAPDITRLVPGDSIYINAAGNRWWVVPNCTACERIAPPARVGFRHLQTVGETVRRRDVHKSGHYNIEGREH